MDEQTMTQAEADRLCAASSALYFRLVWVRACRRGEPAVLPELLAPLGGCRCITEFDLATVVEAEAFLTRLGVIASHDPGESMRIHEL